MKIESGFLEYLRLNFGERFVESFTSFSRKSPVMTRFSGTIEKKVWF